jgi:hypothetical protein
MVVCCFDKLLKVVLSGAGLEKEMLNRRMETLSPTAAGQTLVVRSRAVPQLHAILLATPGGAAGNDIAVSWLGRLTAPALMKWVSTAGGRVKNISRFIVDIWSGHPTDPQTYTQHDLLVRIGDLVTGTDGTLTIRVSSEDTGRRYYLWGTVGDSQPGDATARSEVGLLLGLSDLLIPPGRTLLAQLIQMTVENPVSRSTADRIVERLILSASTY